jgi:hypothetical protein
MRDRVQGDATIVSTLNDRARAPSLRLGAVAFAAALFVGVTGLGCMPGGTDAGTTTCEDDVDCPVPDLCIDGTCQDPAGAGCESDADCPGDLRCITETGRCRADVQCVDDSECCAPGQPCESTCVDFTCIGGECSEGDLQPCFVGCHRGNRPCNNGTWGECNAPPVLDTELCDDAIDNDCNGDTDEGCGECEPGDTRTVACGQCGFSEETCNPSGAWVGSDICEAEGVCEPGAEESTECGNCGTQVRTCGNQCQWNEWSECFGPPDACSPGVTQQQGCGVCGAQERTCLNGCVWSDWDTCDENAGCNPGDEQSQPCGLCGEQISVCDNQCGWGPFGQCINEGSCSPGQIETESCGSCGSRSRQCGDDCQWEDWGSCTGGGVCTPGDTTTEDCGPGTDEGICVIGSRTRNCNNNCQWDPPGTCNGAVYPGFEECGNGIDEDCNGEDSTLPDAYEPNGSCQSAAWLGTDPNQSYSATYDSLDDFSDWFVFFGADSADPTENINISVTNVPPSMDLDLYLYKGGDDAQTEDCTQAELIDSSNAILNGGDESISRGEAFASSDSAYYYIEIRTFGDPSCYAPYTLDVDGLR